MAAMAAFAKYCRLVLVYNLAVILWGALVRASGSGAGCGSHWPTCNGQVVPPKPSAATLIEYSHRLSSGLVLVLVAVLAIWAFRLVPRGHPIRLAATLAVAFTISEAAVGAGLVLFKLVAHDESLARALFVAAHLCNTLLLLAALAFAAHQAGIEAAPPRATPLPGGLANQAHLTPLIGGLAAIMLLSATGAVAALGDTLFPAATLREGLAQDLSPTAHFLLRLRAFHPFLALAAGAYLLYLCHRPLHPATRPWANRVRLLVLAQWTLGPLNLLLLAPLLLQLAHLLLANLLWLALVFMSLSQWQASEGRLVHAPDGRAPVTWRSSEQEGEVVAEASRQM
ncbi:MAG TPA: COX15/CtaA family protein [Thermoanaerobaculia bacterium]|nr:COX15/CtaA family protein [Thermoanaerobaculia bacterium]